MHDHEKHEHSHHDHHPETAVSKGWKWTAVLGNAAIGAAELITGNVATMAVAADGVHNAADTATYYMQAEAASNNKMSAEKKQRWRKVAHWIIAATSLGVSAKVGVDWANGQEYAAHGMATYAAGASLALNGVLLGKLHSNQKRKTDHHASEHEHDLKKHFWAVDIPSAALALGGAVLQKYSITAEHIAAIASGLLGAYAFRPTKANLAHDCPKFDGLAETTPISQPAHHAQPEAQSIVPIPDRSSLAHAIIQANAFDYHMQRFEERLAQVEGWSEHLPRRRSCAYGWEYGTIRTR